MRYIDEVLALYPGKDASTRKFILAQILDHPADHFSGQIVDTLWIETRSADSIVRRQARYTLGQYLPVHTALGYRLLSENAEPTEVPATPEGRRLSAGAAAWLEPQLEELMGLMLERGSSQERAAISFVLGRLHTPRVIEELVSQVAGVEKVSYQAAFALAEAGDETAVAELVKAARQHGRSRPDLFMLLRGVPCPASLACLEASEPKVDQMGRANIAMALAQFGSSQCRPLLERLVRRREGWVTAYALDTLSGSGDADDLPLIRLAWELESHEFIRVQAVRAAGTIRTDAAREFCMEVLASSPGRLQSVALEALAGQQAPRDQLATLATPFLESDFVRTRVQAMLLVAKRDPDAVAPSLSRMVLAPEPLLRLEAAFVAGFVRAPGSRQLLERMAHSDPSAAVRLQAVKSLGRYPVRDALPALIRLLAHPAAPIVTTACRALAGLDAPGDVATALADALAGVTNPATRAIVLPAAGAAARAAGRPPPAAILDALDHADPVIRLGALEGLKYAGDAIPVERVMPLLVHEDPRLRARAALVAFLAGQPEQTGVLTAMLTSGDEAQSMEAVGALQELALVAPLLTAHGFSRVAAKLNARAPAAAPVVAAAHTLPSTARSTQRVPSLRKPELLRALAQGLMPPEVEVLTSKKDLTELVASYDRKAKDDMAGASTPNVIVPLASRAVPLPIPGIELDAPTAVGLTARPLTRRKRGKQDPPPPSGVAKPVVAALFAAVLLCAAVAFRSVGAGSPASPGVRPSVEAPGTRLRVFLVRGNCSGTLKGAPADRLAVGTYLNPGDRVETGTGGHLTLRSGNGISLLLEEQAQIRIGEPATVPGHAEPAMVLEDPGGEQVVETRVIEVHTRMGRAVFKLKAGQGKFRSTAEGWEVEQVAGDGWIQEDAGSRRVLVPGQHQTVPR